ncbi:MAG: glycine--tRNA ligase subunit beta [Deltaproteobacteria bacterium]
MNHEMLLEIGTEEIPAGYILPALQNLRTIFADHLKNLDLVWGQIATLGTPRRLVVWVDQLASKQPDRRDEVIGPPKSAAFDKDGKPTRAAEGSLLPQIISELPFPKSMRWGSGRTAFARPIQWLLALYGAKEIPFSINDISSSSSTRGHRFMSPETVTVTDFKQYQQILAEKHVLVNPDKRRQAVFDAVRTAAEKVGGQVLADDELLDTVCNLVEEPHAVCGTFEERFLALPKEVLITSMREHQKYFAVVDQNGKLFPCFIAVNNTGVRDHVLAAEGHQRVIRARLEDALFFFKEDRQHQLEELVQKLSGIVFQRKLGTMLEKTVRITSLAGWLAGRLSPEKKATAERAAYLAKADLLSEMVGEFPTLQGVMGREYARMQGESEDVAIAVYEHYMPVRAGSQLPATKAGILVSLADRMDTLAGCFGIGETPSGTADPFGLRRLAIGLLHIIEEKDLHLSLSSFIDQALSLYGAKLTIAPAKAKGSLLAFIQGRFTNDQLAKGFAQGTIEAAVSVDFDDPRDCLNRIRALQKISSQEAFALLAGSFKRVKNIIKENVDTEISSDLLVEEAEKNLHAAFLRGQEAVTPMVTAKDYDGALLQILTMKEPIDAFFDQVMVMADDAGIRRNRLALLTAIAQLFLSVGDFSKMSGGAG